MCNDFVIIQKMQLICSYKSHPFLGKIIFSLDNHVLLLLFSHSVVFDFLRPHGLQHTKLP